MPIDDTMPVSLVIPGRNCSATLAACLQSVMPLRAGGDLAEIIFVDDGSTDDTVAVAQRFPVIVLRGNQNGAGAARNLGWRHATGDLIWFVDSDCVVASDALPRLLAHLDDPQVAAVGGSLTNATPHALLACLVHEEIIERHRRMPPRVNFLATANVLYRRAVLEEMGGFDERFLKGQDAELAWRVSAAGYQLGFEFTSRAAHHYHLRWRTYLKSQAQQGYWRVWLHLSHEGHAAGDSYSSLLDHLQPPLALLTLAATPTLAFAAGRWFFLALAVLLVVLHAPATVRLMRRTRQWRYAVFLPMSVLRSAYRGVGLAAGVVAYTLRRNPTPSTETSRHA